MIAADRILPLLSRVRSVGDSRWIARCPAHDDGFPSLSLRQADDRALLHCWAACPTEAIVAALGLTFADLFDDQRRHAKPDPVAQRKRDAGAGLEKWWQCKLQRIAEELRTRDTIIRHIDAAVQAGTLTEDGAMVSLEYEHRRYSELEYEFDRLLYNQDVLQLWRESKLGDTA